jgi:hypothetical protein
MSNRVGGVCRWAFSTRSLRGQSTMKPAVEAESLRQSDFQPLGHVGKIHRTPPSARGSASLLAPTTYLYKPTLQRV